MMRETGWFRRLAVVVLLGLPSLAVAVNYPERGGFPFQIPGGGQLRGGHPAIADLGNTPGHKSIVFGTSNKLLYIVEWVNSTTWRVRPGFPVTLPGDPVGSPAIGDLGSGHPDIVIGYGSTFSNPGKGGVMAISRDGTLHGGGAVLWDHPSGDFNNDGVSDPVIGAPAIGDIDGDGFPDIVYGSLDANVYALNAADGSLKAGWPIFVRDTIFSAPALHDIDGDGKLDVVIGTDAHLEGSPYNTPAGGCLHVFRYDGTEVLGFPRCIDQVIVSAPVVGDIDGDGRPEIVVGTGMFYPSGTHAVHAFKCDGTLAAGWPVAVDGQVASSPALADLDGDGILDVVVTDFTSSPSFLAKVYAFKGTTGALLWKRIPLMYAGGQAPSAGDPVVADALGRSSTPSAAQAQVLVAVNTEIVAFSNTGTQLTESQSGLGGLKSFGTSTTISNVGATTIDSSSVMDVVTVSATPFPSALNTEVHVFNPPRTYAVPTPPWGMVRGNVARTGVYPGTAACVDAHAPTTFVALTPCRLLDTRNTAGTWGGPSLGAARARAFPVVGRCGIPADAKSLSVNLTAVNQSAAGNVQVYGGTWPSPTALTVLYNVLQTRAACALVQVGAGAVVIQNNQFAGTADVVLDVNGYYH